MIYIASTLKNQKTIHTCIVEENHIFPVPFTLSQCIKPTYLTAGYTDNGAQALNRSLPFKSRWLVWMPILPKCKSYKKFVSVCGKFYGLTPLCCMALQCRMVLSLSRLCCEEQILTNTWREKEIEIRDPGWTPVCCTWLFKASRVIIMLGSNMINDKIWAMCLYK